MPNQQRWILIVLPEGVPICPQFDSSLERAETGLGK